ncbi:MAG: DegT/DnrJ/EryC1/StrS family aminotransferase, partial [Prevotella sp.]|nr:DegT/DnrJ/EryC1/StrS family aminotransferase [Prevotella sp.]
MIRYLDLNRITAMHGEEISAAVDNVVRSGWYLKGTQTTAFENSYADFIGTRHCIGCGNGLDALTLIFRAYIEMGVM